MKEKTKAETRQATLNKEGGAAASLVNEKERRTMDGGRREGIGEGVWDS